LICPICQKRKAKRFCPAKAETICPVCCGTEREVTIDCPAECPHLIASRQRDFERHDVKRGELPFPDLKITASFLADHEDLLLDLSYAICLFARDNSALVDSDLIATLKSLAEAYRTLASGIVYENPPAYHAQRELYQMLKAAIEEYKTGETGKMVVTSVRNIHNGEIGDTLAFLTQLGALRSNGRPKGRAYLDFLRTHFHPEALSKSASDIVVLA
jgi:hypothetical protein